MPHLEATLKEAATNDCKTDFAAGEAVCCALARGDFYGKMGTIEQHLRCSMVEITIDYDLKKHVPLHTTSLKSFGTEGSTIYFNL